MNRYNNSRLFPIINSQNLPSGLSRYAKSCTSCDFCVPSEKYELRFECGNHYSENFMKLAGIKNKICLCHTNLLLWLHNSNAGENILYDNKISKDIVQELIRKHEIREYNSRIASERAMPEPKCMQLLDEDGYPGM